MDQGTLDSPVTLVIKAPNQKYDDQTINCFLNWTVEKLKKHISKVYPSKPVSFILFYYKVSQSVANNPRAVLCKQSY